MRLELPTFILRVRLDLEWCELAGGTDSPRCSLAFKNSFRRIKGHMQLAFLKVMSRNQGLLNFPGEVASVGGGQTGYGGFGEYPRRVG
jgi:hypothetical protein